MDRSAGMAKLMDPMDKRTKRFPFSYTSSARTDVRKTIAAELRRLAEQKKKDEQIKGEQQEKVRKLTNGNSR
jgi:hypothetical protein